MTPSETAEQYIARGWAVVPVRPRSKAPTTDEWQNGGFTARDFGPRSNIGVILGESSNGLVDIDLDCPEAVELAHDLLPGTGLAFGRGGVRTHLLYITDTPTKSRRWKDANGKMIIELRSTGCQTIFPGSVHPSGAVVEWILEGEPAHVPWQHLVDACAELADAVGRNRGETQLSPAPPATPSNGDRTRLLTRAERYVDKAKASVEGGRNDQCLSIAGHVRGITENGDRLTESEILDLMRTYWNPRNSPPMDDAELARTVHSAMVNGTPRSLKPGNTQPPEPPPDAMTAAELLSGFPTQREPLIEGLLRRAEVLNIVSGPKCYKSWLLMHLALAVALGTYWLKFATRQGRVLLLDYELAPGTLSRRLNAVMHALGISPDALGDDLHVVPLRGKRLDAHGVAKYLESRRGRYDLIIADPLYRLYPPTAFDENSNSDVANLYATIQGAAEAADAAIALVHHVSKGDQSGKATADVGSGASSQARACDSHLVLRPHAEDHCAVLSAIVRSFPPVDDFGLRWCFPIWHDDPTLDPLDLRKPPRKPRGQPTEIKAPAPPKWTPERLAALVDEKPIPQDELLAKARSDGCGPTVGKNLLAEAVTAGLIHRWRLPKDNRVHYATVPQPGQEVAS